MNTQNQGRLSMPFTNVAFLFLGIAAGFIAGLMSSTFLPTAVIAWCLAFMGGFGVRHNCVSRHFIPWRTILYSALGLFLGGLIPWGVASFGNDGPHWFILTRWSGWLIGATMTPFIFLVGGGINESCRWFKKTFLTTVEISH
jgi:hypothetical protein